MFKTETHIHTSEVSMCSHKRAKEMVKIYKERGYSTIFITDHFQANSVDSYGDIPWSDKMAIFLSGYYRAKAEGDKIGLNVLPGAEFCFPGIPNHYLAYGITREFLDANPEIHKTDIETFSKIAHEAGIFIVQAHPYRDGKAYPTPDFIDAIEVYNSNPRHEDNSELSEEAVRKFNLPVTAGSDAHRDEDIAITGLVSEYEIKTAEDFIKLIKSREAKIIRERV
ncbi:MAG: PHP domain-containing protein [Ruminococcaceae bacterium]|nr:PHP domain-containing protein [Oscillospiraceae bacterium]